MGWTKPHLIYQDIEDETVIMRMSTIPDLEAHGYSTRITKTQEANTAHLTNREKCLQNVYEDLRGSGMELNITPTKTAYTIICKDKGESMEYLQLINNDICRVTRKWKISNKLGRLAQEVGRCRKETYTIFSDTI